MECLIHSPAFNNVGMTRVAGVGGARGARRAAVVEAIRVLLNRVRPQEPGGVGAAPRGSRCKIAGAVHDGSRYLPPEPILLNPSFFIKARHQSSPRGGGMKCDDFLSP